MHLQNNVAFSINARAQQTTNIKYTKIIWKINVCGICRRVFFALSTLAMRIADGFILISIHGMRR